MTVLLWIGAGVLCLALLFGAYLLAAAVLVVLMLRDWTWKINTVPNHYI